MKKIKLYHMSDVSPWPLASSIGAVLLTSGFAWNNHRINYNMISNYFDLKKEDLNVVEVISEVIKELRRCIEVSIESQMILFIGEFIIIRRIWSKKKILCRFYSEPYFNENHKFIVEQSSKHNSQAITMLEVVNNTKKDLDFESGMYNVKTINDIFITKSDVEIDIIKDLNNLSSNELVLKKQFEKGEISRSNYLFLNNLNKNFNVSKGFKLKSGEKIEVMHVTNLTRSPKNASNIIMKGEVGGILEKGLYSYNNWSLYVFLHNEEMTKKAVFLVAIFYKVDQLNKNILILTKKQEKMDSVIEANIKEKIKIFSLELVICKSLWKDNKMVLDYLTELLRKKKW